MRKANKATIQTVLGQLLLKEADWQIRLSKINHEYTSTIREWMADLRGRIEAGECTNNHACTRALAQSVERDIRAWESGYYKGLTENGGRMVA